MKNVSVFGSISPWFKSYRTEKRKKNIFRSQEESAIYLPTIMETGLKPHPALKKYRCDEY